MKALMLGMALALAASGAQARDLVLQTKGLDPARSSGYVVASHKGFYRAEGLDVTVLAAQPDHAPTEALARGKADIIVEWMPAALVARERGLPLVNIAQPFGRPGLTLICLGASGIADPARDLAGKTLGTRFLGDEYPLVAWLSGLGLPATGGPAGVRLVDQGSGVRALMGKRANCITTSGGDEYGQALAAGLTPADLDVLRPWDHGKAWLEDGLYVLDNTLQDARRVDDLARFVRASMKGWRDVRDNPRDAALILWGADADPLTFERKIGLIRNVTDLVTDDSGTLDPTAYRTTVEVLRGGDAGAVLSRIPQGAITDRVTRKAGPAGPDRPAASAAPGGQTSVQTGGGR